MDCLALGTLLDWPLLAPILVGQVILFIDRTGISVIFQAPRRART